jgi:hypothetical protein
VTTPKHGPNEALVLHRVDGLVLNQVDGSFLGLPSNKKQPPTLNAKPRPLKINHPADPTDTWSEIQGYPNSKGPDTGLGTHSSLVELSQYHES